MIIASTSPEAAAASARRASSHRLASMGTSVVLGALTLLFAVAHISQWRETGRPTGLVFAAQELVLVAFFVVRRRPVAVSRRPADWVAALVGAYGVLLLRPTGHEVLGLGGVWLGLQVVAGVGAVVCVLRLGRSFGVVAANRGVRSDGPYRFVRHPMYASYLVGQVAYLLGAFSATNVAVVVLALGGQVVRISAEERVLRGDDTYRAYCRRVTYRLIPGLY